MTPLKSGLSAVLLPVVSVALPRVTPPLPASEKTVSLLPFSARTAGALTTTGPVSARELPPAAAATLNVPPVSVMAPEPALRALGTCSATVAVSARYCAPLPADVFTVTVPALNTNDCPGPPTPPAAVIARFAGVVTLVAPVVCVTVPAAFVEVSVTLAPVAALPPAPKAMLRPDCTVTTPDVLPTAPLTLTSAVAAVVVRVTVPAPPAVTAAPTVSVPVACRLTVPLAAAAVVTTPDVVTAPVLVTLTLDPAAVPAWVMPVMVSVA